MVAVAAAIGVVSAAVVVPTPAWAQVQEPEPVVAWEERVIYGDEIGVDQPTGLAIDTSNEVLYVIDRSQSTLVGVNLLGDPIGDLEAPNFSDPLNLAFDSSSRRVLALTSAGLEARSTVGSGPPVVIGRPSIQAPAGVTFDAASGTAYILDAQGPRVLAVGSDGEEDFIVLGSLARHDLRGIAFNPADGRLYVASPSAEMVFALDGSGDVAATFDLSDVGLRDPQAMAFVASTDPTDDPADMSLMVADSGTTDSATTSSGLTGLEASTLEATTTEATSSDGRIVEVSLEAKTQAAQSSAVATLVATNFTSNLNPPSPDSSGIAYLSNSGRLLLSDSEVNEMTIFQNVNLWELTLDVNLSPLETGVTLPWSNEPTGASFNDASLHLYLTDDTGTRGVYDVDPAGDGLYGTSDDVVTQLETSPFGNSDPEGVAYDPVSGDIFVSDGVAKEVYRYNPGPDGLFNGVGDTLVASFDTELAGAIDPEGISYEPFSDTLLVVDHDSDAVYEFTKTGTLIRVIDVSPADAHREAGLVLAPASDGSSGWNMYIAARGVDNGADPNENDGRIYEMSLDFGPTGSPPVANDDTASTDEDAAVEVDVVANDTDPDGDLDPSSITVTGAASNGNAVPGPTAGSVTYTPDPDFNGSDSFIYQVCDLSTSCDTATVTVTVNPIADAPVANDDTATTDSGVAVEIDVVANDTDPDGDLDPSSVTVTGAATNGSAVPGPTAGSVTYTPNGGFVGTDTFVYQVCDSTAPTPLCDTATVTVGVTGAPPVANDDTASTDEDAAVEIDVVANDTDPDGDLDPSSVTVTGPASNGSAVPGPTAGSVTYTPDPDFNGSDSFTYQVCDLSTSCDTATVTVTVNPIGDAPVANDDSASTSEDTAVEIDVVANDTDTDGDLDPSSVTVTGAASNGNAVPGPTAGSVTYTPNGGFVGTDTFVYQVCDSTAPTPLCDTATVTVTTGPAGPVYYVSSSSSMSLPGIPMSVSDEDIVAYDATTGSWLMFYEASDVGITTSDLDAFHVRDNGSVLISYSSNAMTIPGLIGGPNGETIDDEDIILFTPSSVGEETAGVFTFYFDGSDVDLTGSGEDIDGLYEFDDGSLAISTAGLIEVGALPQGGDEDIHVFTGTFGSDTSGTWTHYFDGSDIGLAAADDDLNALSFDNGGDMLFSTKIAYAAAGGSGEDEDISRFVGTFGPVTSGTASLEVDMSALGFDPLEDVDAFHLGHVFTSGPTGAPPVANDDTATTDEDVAVEVDVVANDTDPDGDLDPSSVTVTGAASNGSAVPGPTAGSVTYTPDPDFNGSDSFIYQVCDATAACDTATVTVTVNPIGDAPVANDDTASTGSGVAVEIDVVANDTDTDGDLDPSSVTVTGPASNGSAVPGPTAGSVTYTPNGGFTGTDTFVYQVCDSTAPTPLCDTATVTVGVTGAPPVANDDTASTDEDVAVEVDVVANDTDPDGDLDPSSVTVTGAASNGSAVPGPTAGSVTYTPDPDFNGSDSFTYQVCDAALSCDTATVTVTVNPIADAPVANDDTASTSEGTAVEIDVVANDTDTDGDLDPSSVTVTGAASNGSAVPGPTAGSVTYTPNGGFVGTDTFVYQVCDSTAPTPLCDTATVTVGVTGAPPVANDDTASTDEDAAVEIDVVANDTDANGDLDPSSVTVTGPASNGSAVPGPTAGSVTYTPDPDFNGSDSFIYQVCDATAACDTATVTVTVNPIADAPVANDDTASTSEDTAVEIDVVANDTDTDGDLDPSSVTVTGPASNGSAVPGPTAGSVTYTPNGGFVGTDTFVYQVCDSTAPTPLCDTATVTVTTGPAGVEYRSHVTASTEDALFLTIPKPAGTVSGDVLVAFLISSQNGGMTWTPPAGWVQIDTPFQAGSFNGSAWYRVAGAGEPTDYTWDVSGENEIAGTIFAISGADTANPIAAQSSDKQRLPHTATVTTPVDDTLLIVWSALDASGPHTWSNADGMTEHFEETVTATSLSHAGFTGTSGPAGAYSRTVDGSARGSTLVWLVAIAPA